MRERAGGERSAEADVPVGAATSRSGLASALVDLPAGGGQPRSRRDALTSARSAGAERSPPPPPPPGAPPGWSPDPPKAKTPKEKLQPFVTSGAAKGLPTALFGPVLEHYAIGEGDIDENETSTAFNEIVFKRGCSARSARVILKVPCSAVGRRWATATA